MTRPFLDMLERAAVRHRIAVLTAGTHWRVVDFRTRSIARDRTFDLDRWGDAVAYAHQIATEDAREMDARGMWVA